MNNILILLLILAGGWLLNKSLKTGHCMGCGKRVAHGSIECDDCFTERQY